MNIYYNPEGFGLAPVGEIDWSDGCYQFNLTVVWKRDSDGRFVYSEDSGCSCPSPFEDKGISDLVPLRKQGGLNDFKAHCAERQAERPHEDRSAEVAALLERLHGEGLR